MKSKLIFLYLVTAMTSAIAFSNTEAESSVPLSLQTKVYKGCGFVIGTKAVGTGFWVGSNTFVTCLHVVADAGESLKIETVGGKVYHVTSVLNYSLNDDVAVLELEPSNSTCLELLDEPSVGTKIWSIGNSEGAEVLKIDEGAVTALGVRVLEMTAQIRPGCSGGPIVDSDGHVLGMSAFCTFPMISKGKHGYVRDMSLDNARKFAIISSTIQRCSSASLTNVVSIRRIQSLNAERKLAPLFCFIDDHIAQSVYKALSTKLTFQDNQKKSAEQTGIVNHPYGQVEYVHKSSEILQDGYLLSSGDPAPLSDSSDQCGVLAEVFTQDEDLRDMDQCCSPLIRNLWANLNYLIKYLPQFSSEYLKMPNTPVANGSEQLGQVEALRKNLIIAQRAYAADIAVLRRQNKDADSVD